MSDVQVDYLEDNFGGYVKMRRDVPRLGMMGNAPGQQADGYGRKISTDWMVRCDDGMRLFRVYCICFSNSGSLYIKRGGDAYYLRDLEGAREVK